MPINDAPQGFHARPTTPTAYTLVSFAGNPELAAVASGGGTPIRNGSRSAVDGPVGLVQERLDVLGYLHKQGGTVDGSFGPKSEAALKAFQHERGLTADGVVGRDTLIALDREPGQTWGIQRALVELGYSIGSAGVDGILGEHSIQAIHKFQADKHLLTSGILDEVTLVELEKAVARVRPALESVVPPKPPPTPHATPSDVNAKLAAQQLELLRNPSLSTDVHLAAVATLVSLHATTELRHAVQEAVGGDPRVLPALVEALVQTRDKGAITFLELQPDRYPVPLRPWVKALVHSAVTRLRALP